MKKYTKKFLFVIFIFSLGFIVSSLINKSNNIYEEQEQKQIKKHVDTISMMLETEANSGNYEMTTRESWPTDGYVFNCELSVCEHGGELSWDDINKKILMSGNTSDKCYVYFDKALTLETYVKSQYTGVQGENSIYYHNGTIVSDDGTIIDANDSSYRYAGASESVNNYICLDSTESPCPDAKLFRIIGVINDHVKVISTKSVGNMAWDSRGSNTWSKSSLNTYLNDDYLKSLGLLSKEIFNTIWKVGGNTYANLRNEIASIAYQNEITTPNENGTSTTGETECSAKIGLMYGVDYGFAADPSMWTKKLYDYSYNNVKSLSWLYNGNQWMISRISGGSDYSLLAISFGVASSPVTEKFGVFPTFNLLSTIVYQNGQGSIENPMRISY